MNLVERREHARGRIEEAKLTFFLETVPESLKRDSDFVFLSEFIHVSTYLDKEKLLEHPELTSRIARLKAKISGNAVLEDFSREEQYPFVMPARYLPEERNAVDAEQVITDTFVEIDCLDIDGYTQEVWALRTVLEALSADNGFGSMRGEGYSLAQIRVQYKDEWELIQRLLDSPVGYEIKRLLLGANQTWQGATQEEQRRAELKQTLLHPLAIAVRHSFDRLAIDEHTEEEQAAIDALYGDLRTTSSAEIWVRDLEYHADLEAMIDEQEVRYSKEVQQTFEKLQPPVKAADVKRYLFPRGQSEFRAYIAFLVRRMNGGGEFGVQVEQAFTQMMQSVDAILDCLDKIPMTGEQTGVLAVIRGEDQDAERKRQRQKEQINFKTQAYRTLHSLLGACFSLEDKEAVAALEEKFEIGKRSMRYLHRACDVRETNAFPEQNPVTNNFDGWHFRGEMPRGLKRKNVGTYDYPHEEARITKKSLRGARFKDFSFHGRHISFDECDCRGMHIEGSIAQYEKKPKSEMFPALGVFFEKGNFDDVSLSNVKKIVVGVKHRVKGNEQISAKRLRVRGASECHFYGPIGEYEGDLLNVEGADIQSAQVDASNVCMDDASIQTGGGGVRISWGTAKNLQVNYDTSERWERWDMGKAYPWKGSFFGFRVNLDGSMVSQAEKLYYQVGNRSSLRGTRILRCSAEHIQIEELNRHNGVPQIDATGFVLDTVRFSPNGRSLISSSRGIHFVGVDLEGIECRNVRFPGKRDWHVSDTSLKGGRYHSTAYAKVVVEKACFREGVDRTDCEIPFEFV